MVFVCPPVDRQVGIIVVKVDRSAVAVAIVGVTVFKADPASCNAQLRIGFSIDRAAAPGMEVGEAPSFHGQRAVIQIDRTAVAVVVIRFECHIA